MANTITKLIWLRSLHHELGQQPTVPAPICYDNISATHLSLNPWFKAKTKHIKVDYRFVRELVSFLSMQHISIQDQLADIFTKPLSTTCFLALRSKLRILPKHLNLRGVLEIKQVAAF